MHRTRFDDDRWDRVRPRRPPFLVDAVDLAAEPARVDPAAGCQRADHDRHGVLAAGGVDHVLEQERLALALRDPAPELPADERVQLGVLVDRAVHADQEAVPLQRRQMLMQVGVGPRRGDLPRLGYRHERASVSGAPVIVRVRVPGFKAGLGTVAPRRHGRSLLHRLCASMSLW